MAWIKKAYLYLATLIALVILLIGSITLINMALKQWVFTKADMPYRYPQMECTNAVEAEKLPQCRPGYTEEQEQFERENRAAQRQRDAAQSLAMILVAGPVFWFHWRLAKAE